MSRIATTNRGPLIVSSTYWGSAIEEAGKLWISTNAGAIRVLVPRVMQPIIEDMTTAKYVICSRGPWPAAGRDDAMELFFEDHSDNPFSLHVGPESVDLFPGEPDEGRQWVCTVWQIKNEQPHKAIELACHWRRVEKLPWLKPLAPR